MVRPIPAETWLGLAEPIHLVTPSMGAAHRARFRNCPPACIGLLVGRQSATVAPWPSRTSSGLLAYARIPAPVSHTRGTFLSPNASGLGGICSEGLTGGTKNRYSVSQVCCMTYPPRLSCSFKRRPSLKAKASLGRLLSIRPDSRALQDAAICVPRNSEPQAVGSSAPYCGRVWLDRPPARPSQNS